jgi:hypothetical protein
MVRHADTSMETIRHGRRWFPMPRRELERRMFYWNHRALYPLFAHRIVRKALRIFRSDALD